MMVPFFSILFKVTGTDREFSTRLTSTLRLDDIVKGPMSTREVIVVEQDGFLEREVASLFNYNIQIAKKRYKLKELDSVRLINLNGDSITLEFIKDRHSVIQTSAIERNKLRADY